MNVEIKGSISKIEETKSYGKNNFLKRLIVITVPSKYPVDIPVEFVKDKTSILDNYAEGQQVTVNANLKGNNYNDRWFLNLIGWKINADEDSQPASAVNKYKQEPELPNEPEEPEVDDEDSDDFPY